MHFFVFLPKEVHQVIRNEIVCFSQPKVWPLELVALESWKTLCRFIWPFVIYTLNFKKSTISYIILKCITGIIEKVNWLKFM